MECLSKDDFNWVISATLHRYIDEGLKDMTKEGKEALPAWVFDLKSACFTTYRLLHPLKLKQAEKIAKLESEEFREKMKTEIAFIVFAMEAARLWVDSGLAPIIISRIKRAKMGANEYVVPLLKLKLADKESYEEKSAIVKDSKELAEYWFKYWQEKLCKENEK
jgi:hypothetical protein